jgi:hypothetical protein
MSRDEIGKQAFELAERWQALLGTNGINRKSDLARYVGASRPRVTQVLKRLNNLEECERYLEQNEPIS